MGFDVHILVINASTSNSLEERIRISEGLSDSEAENIRQAAEYARYVGYPLLHHLVIRWLSVDWFSGRDEHEYIQRKVSEWLSNNVGFAFFIWAKEANHRPHSHFLLHLPNKHFAKKLRKRIRGWLKRYHGMPERDGLPDKCLHLRGLPTAWYFDTDSAHVNQVNYVTKRANDLPSVKKDEGIVVGLPCHPSQALSKTARNAGLVPKYRLRIFNEFIPNASQANSPAPPPLKVSKTPFKCERKNAI
mgnify:FL=1